MFVLNSWVSWVNFCWVVVPIWVSVVVVGGSWLASDVVVDGFF